MARPKKDIAEKRDRRLTLYLTQQEEDTLNAVVTKLKMDKTKFCVNAIMEDVKKYGDGKDEDD